MNETITQITFSDLAELMRAINVISNDAYQLGSRPDTVNIRPGVIELVERTLTDGSKVHDIAIAQVQS